MASASKQLQMPSGESHCMAARQRSKTERRSSQKPSAPRSSGAVWKGVRKTCHAPRPGLREGDDSTSRAQCILSEGHGISKEASGSHTPGPAHTSGTSVKRRSHMSSPNSVAHMPPSECVPATQSRGVATIGGIHAHCYGGRGRVILRGRQPREIRVGASAFTLPGAAFRAGIVLERKLLNCALPIVVAQKPALQACQTQVKQSTQMRSACGSHASHA